MTPLILAWTAGPPPYMSWSDVDLLSTPWFWIVTATGIAMVAVARPVLTSVAVFFDIAVATILFLEGAMLPLSIFLFSQGIVAAIRKNQFFLRQAFVLLIVIDLLYIFFWAMAEKDYFDICRAQAGSQVVKIPDELGDSLEAFQAYFIVYSLITCLWGALLFWRRRRVA